MPTNDEVFFFAKIDEKKCEQFTDPIWISHFSDFI